MFCVLCLELSPASPPDISVCTTHRGQRTEIIKLHILTQNSTHFIFIARQSDYGLFQAQYKRWLHKEFWYFMRNVSNIVFVSRTGAKRNWKCVKWAKKSHWIKASQIWDLSQHEMYWEMFLSFVWRPTSGKSPSPLFFLIGANLVCFGSERHIAPFVQTTGTQHKILFDMINVFGRKKLMHDMIIFGMDYHFVVLSSNKKW